MLYAQIGWNWTSAFEIIEMWVFIRTTTTMTGKFISEELYLSFTYFETNKALLELYLIWDLSFTWALLILRSSKALLELYLAQVNQKAKQSLISSFKTFIFPMIFPRGIKKDIRLPCLMSILISMDHPVALHM